MKGSTQEEPPEEFGLLSQLLFMFCALKSLEIKFLLKLQSTAISLMKAGLGQVIPPITFLRGIKGRVRIIP